MSNPPTNTSIHPGFSSANAAATPWDAARRKLEATNVYWIATTRPDGQPHLAPLLAIVHDDRVFFATGAHERKARNIATNQRATIVSGDSTDHGLDIVIEGTVHRVTDEPTLVHLAELWEAKYGPGWRFIVANGAFYHAEASIREDDPGAALVFEITPNQAFGFGKGDPYSQTRWRW
jgi:general stress protein 26